MLIEFHLIQNHAPANLNRDDTGSPKEAYFGGYRRARISSQCLKRSIRKSPLFHDELGEELAVRTRRLPEQVQDALQKQLGRDEDQSRRIAARAAVIGSAKKQEKDKEDADKSQASPPQRATRPSRPTPPPSNPGRRRGRSRREVRSPLSRET